MSDSIPIVVIGAGPAGLTAAYELSKQGRRVVVLEKDAVVGGLARTTEYQGFRCDIGGHRFFTKSPYVDALWHDLLGERFLRRPRLSRIYYGGKFYQYPLKIGNAFRNLGPWQSLAVIGSLVRSRLLPCRPETTFRQWVSNRFGRRLFEIFFRGYTEKLWGISCDSLSADWAAQRIKNLSLIKAVLAAMKIGGRKSIASLIEEFDYPSLGPGEMYEALADRCRQGGVEIRLGAGVAGVEQSGGQATGVLIDGPGGRERLAASAVFSSMPLDELVLAVRPAPPAEVLSAGAALHYRSIVTVNLLVHQRDVAPDTWIYLQDPSVKAGRLQLYKNWSPRMVPDPEDSVIGLEYFCSPGDALWNAPDAELLATAAADLRTIGIVDPSKVFGHFVVKYGKAYPVYDEGYQQRVRAIRQYLGGIGNVYAIGRYGQFRYNNMDHSILTAQYAVRRLLGEDIDPWSVNEDQEYHEEQAKGG